MSANVNVETGIAYGVADARDYMGLYEDITSKGKNLSYAAFRAEAVKGIAAAIEDYVSGAKEAEEQAGDIFDNLEVDYQGEEDEYEYEDKEGNQFLLGHLGGAPLIWCIKTSKVVRARRCSPCVPGAGDLNNLDEDGMECYGVPDCYAEENDLAEHDSNGTA